jgi:hypothetical protein
MEQQQLKKAYRNAWILLALVTAFVVLFFLFTVKANEEHPAVEWDMGGVEFVPASSTYANGYYTEPVSRDEEGESEAR